MILVPGSLYLVGVYGQMMHAREDLVARARGCVCCRGETGLCLARVSCRFGWSGSSVPDLSLDPLVAVGVGVFALCLA